jgi:CheY-like chemotaxis protein
MQNILIVEDDARNNQILKEYLEGHGYILKSRSNYTHV